MILHLESPWLFYSYKHVSILPMGVETHFLWKLKDGFLGKEPNRYVYAVH